MKKNKKGFSHVEIILSLLVISIILAFATSFFFTGENLFRNTVQSETEKAVGDNTLNYMVESIRYAQDIEVVPSDQMPTAKYQRAIFLSDKNYIGFKVSDEIDENIYGEYFYQNNTVDYSAKVLNANCMEIKVNVYNRDGEMKYTTSSVVKLLNMNVNNKVIGIDSSLKNTEIKNAVISFDK